jgi:hypothetical protein
LNDRSFRQISHPEQQVYEHLLACVRVELPSQLIERFCSLFINGVGYPDAQIASSVEQIVNSKQAEEEFPFFLNRCCHILINRWQTQPQTQGAIPQLVELLENPPSGANTYSRSLRRLRQLLKLFTETDQYMTLRRLAQVMSQAAETTGIGFDTRGNFPRTSGNYPQTSVNNIDTSDDGSTQVKTLIRRYPFLYPHYLLSQDSSYEQQQTIRQIQAQTQHRFEVNLSQYVTYQVRRVQLSRQTPAQTSGRVIQPVKNPTLLSDRELGTALKHFVGKVEGGYTYRDLAHRFLSHTSQVPSFKVFKDDFYEYLTSAINPSYGKRQFNDKLYNHLKNIVPESDYQKPSELLIVRTCSQVLSHLIVESPQRPNHFMFVDLISNMGATFTTGILLKIVLFCRKVKSFLEKRFTILFNHYESFTRDGVPWLITSLENLNVAFSIHMGKADVSCLKYII